MPSTSAAAAARPHSPPDPQYRPRQAATERLVRTGHALLIAAIAFMSLGLTWILVLISNIVFGASAAIVAGILALAVVSVAWFAVPISPRRALSDR